jgi:hypothetical protein
MMQNLTGRGWYLDLLNIAVAGEKDLYTFRCSLFQDVKNTDVSECCSCH